MEIIRKLLTPDEISNPAVRWNEDCDCVQQTPDGGDTWVDAPGLDPRSAPGFQVPPRSGADPKCDAAANMIHFLQQLVDADIHASSLAGLASALFGVLVFIFPPGAIVELILAGAGLVIAIGGEIIDDAFTEDVWDGLLCLFLARLDDSGQIDQAGLFALEDDISAAYPGTVASVFSAHNQSIGVVGWNNAGAKGTATGDCTTCIPGHCKSVNFADEDGSAWGIVNYGGNGTYVPGTGWIGNDIGSDQYNISLLWTLPETMTITNIEVRLTHTAPSTGGGNNANNTDIYYPTLADRTFRDDGNPSGTNIWKAVEVASLPANFIYSDINNGVGNGPTVAVYQMIIYYSSNIPSGWTDDCA